MKKYILLIAIMLVFSAFAFSQQQTKTIKIRTSAQCEQCKDRLEKAMAFEKGVINSNLDLDTKELLVTYKQGKTTPELIQKAVNAVGYDADNTLAQPKAYQKLPACCKKPDDPEHVGH